MMDRRGFRTTYATVSLFTMLAGDAVRYTVSWYGFAALCLALFGVSIAFIRRAEHRPRLSQLSFPLILVVGVSVLSLAWSAYRLETLLAIVVMLITATGAIALAVTFAWREILQHLGRALRLIIGLSLVFELVVSVFVRRPILPFWVDYGGVPIDDLPVVTYWSRDVLFEGARIQGLVGNASLLAWAAALGLVVFALQWADGQVKRTTSMVWLAVALLTIALTRSATVYVIVVAVALVALLVVLLRRTESLRVRRRIWWSAVAVAVLGAASALVFRSTLLAAVGKSDDLTGRLDIWQAVIGLAEQRPFLGWGWISYWVPWREPFDDLIIRNGVVQLHAHNAWLDIWFQLGVLGLLVWGLLVASALIRSSFLAIDREYGADRAPLAFTVPTLLPLLLLVALLVQSLAESRLLLEYGWYLLVLIAVKTKLERYDRHRFDRRPVPLAAVQR